MTRRSSLRAQAREIYRDLAAAKAAETTATPAPGEQDLTARVRALYEESAVPVRDIAAIAGVTERTIYKYAARQRWKKRYARVPEYAPVKGAGARFTRRADKDLPVAQGLKATDPAGAARATEVCEDAALVSDEAQATAKRLRRHEALNRAIVCATDAFRDLREFWQRRDKGPPGPLDDHFERVLTQVFNTAMAHWEALQKEAAAEFTARQSAHPAPAGAARLT